MVERVMLVIALGFFSFVNPESNLPDLQIGIVTGRTQRGERGLSLTQEGLILNSSIIGETTKSEFVEINELNPEALSAIIEFCKEKENFKDFSDRYYSDLNGFVVPRRYIFKSYSSDFSKTIVDKDYLRYRESDSQERKDLDSLLILMNELVPDKYREEFKLKDFSNIRESF